MCDFKLTVWDKPYSIFFFLSVRLKKGNENINTGGEMQPTKLGHS